ncbi:MAG: histidine--tRNA ligase [Gemmatimonadota bacterium]|nr:histidine--tRNA ligase [Gemmatimonadota bacterium]MDH5197396.1 histidine--tRNA ligase [Gemmatimonadota bacterium]
MQGQALPGFRDFYPGDAALRNQIFGVWRDVAARYGFEEYDGPPLEPLELYTEKSGDEIVGQLYEFEDKGGRRVALRPEMTPTLARMVAARAPALKKPIRWFSMPQLFRYERQQRGRLREHFQLNMDLIGEPGPLADAEIAAAAVDVVRTLGFGPEVVRLRISDRRVVAGLLGHAGVPDGMLSLAYGAIDKIERDPPGVLADRLVAGGLSAAIADRVLAVGRLRGQDALDAALAEVPDGADIAEDLSACVGALADMGLGGFVDLDLSIVRGLAYYTGVVFELFDAGRSLRAICGGGRYDGLLRALGGVDLPAVGFGMGDVVLGELITGAAPAGARAAPLDAFLVAVGSDDVSHVLALAHRLRDAGRRVEYALKAQGLGKQLKLAAARGARRAVIVGPDERARGEVVVRDLTDGGEQQIAVERIEDALANV